MGNNWSNYCPDKCPYGREVGDLLALHSLEAMHLSWRMAAERPSATGWPASPNGRNGIQKRPSSQQPT
ncbi:hypothetical protein B0G69_7985 [Paraburkholderia sp. RAU2J]|nr:hypothetical protein B0G69_7985 [Paraburkholderia sp. RAU2J]